jgi:hypothetical protein
VFCRTRVEGADGDGVVIAETRDQLVNARLYVGGIEKTAEYRIHMGRKFDGTITMIGALKKLHSLIDGLDSRVWTGDSVRLVWTINGGQSVADTLPDDVKRVCFKAMELLPELTFAALDVIYHAPTGKAYVVEANSAPMMTPKTAQLYGQFFVEYVEMRDIGDAAVVPVIEYEPTEDDIDRLLAELFNHQVTSREVMVGYLKWINEERD